MADENGKGKDDREPTRRVVVKREQVLVLPDGVRIEELVQAKNEKDIMKLLKRPIGDPYVEAWVVIGEFEGASKTNAIEAHAGEPGTPDAKPGVYRAPSVTAWKDAHIYEAPPQPLVTRRVLADE